MSEGLETQRMSSDRLAAALEHWLSLALTNRRIKARAKEWRFRAWTPRARRKLRDEVTALEMWIVMSASNNFADNEELYAVWDTVYCNLYKQTTKGRGPSLAIWMASMMERCKQYGEAMETEHPSGPLWVVADKLSENLFGEVRDDLAAHFMMMTHIASSIEHLGGVLMKHSTLTTSCVI